MRFHKNNTKLKTLYVLKFFVEHTNKNHVASAVDIIEYLSKIGFSAERKSIYKDIETFNCFGVEIKKKGHGFYYQPREGDFINEITRSF